MRSKRIVGLVKENNSTTKLDWKVASRGMKIYIESRTVNLKENAGLKSQVKISFCHQNGPMSRKAWMFPWKWQRLKKYPRKTCGFSQHWKPFDSRFQWMKGVSVTVQVCVLCDWRFSDTSAGTGKLCILGHLGLVFIWNCFVSCLLFLLFYVSLRNLCSGTCRKIPNTTRSWL